MSETFITNTDTGDGDSGKDRNDAEKKDKNDTQRVHENLEHLEGNNGVFQSGNLVGEEIHDISEDYKRDNSEGGNEDLFAHGLVIDGRHKDLHHRKEHSDVGKTGIVVVQNHNTRKASTGEIEKDANKSLDKEPENEVNGSNVSVTIEEMVKNEANETDILNDQDAKTRHGTDRTLHHMRNGESSMISYESGGLPPKNTPAQSVYGSEPDGRVQQMYVRFPGQRHGLMML